MTSINLNKLEHEARQLTTRWALESLDIVFEGAAYAHLETVLHEAAHAASLKLSLGPDTPDAIGWAIQALEDSGNALFVGNRSDVAINEEAKAWAIEWEVLQRLGLHHIYTWGDALEGAAEQGVDKDRLLQFVDTPMALAGADTVMGWLNEMLEERSVSA